MPAATAPIANATNDVRLNPDPFLYFSRLEGSGFETLFRNTASSSRFIFIVWLGLGYAKLKTSLRYFLSASTA